MKRKRNPIDTIVLVLLCIVAVGLGQFQSAQDSRGRVDIVSVGVKMLLSPVSRPAAGASNSIGDFLYGLLSARRLTEENRRLRALATSASLYSEQLGRLEGELSQMRTLGGFSPIPGKTSVPASVVGYAPYENRLTIDTGQNQGIVPGDPVVSAEGLVGTVRTVEPGRSEIQLLESRGLTIGAIDVSRNPPPAGLLQGESTGTLNLTFQDPKAPVEIGDHIVTSGFSDRIPRGILIGSVISLSTDEEFGSLTAKIDPAVSIGLLREVLVLR